MIFARFAIEKRRKNVRQKNLLRAFEIALGALEILRHDAEIDVFRAEYVANLTKHFVDAHVGTGVARTVVACEEQFKSFAGLPARAAAHHPFQAGYFDEKADPGDEKKISHERGYRPRWSVFAPLLSAHGWLILQWPGLCRIAKFIFATEFQERLRVRGKFGGSFAAEFFDHAGIIENGVPDEVWPEHFQERGTATEITFFVGQPRRSTVPEKVPPSFGQSAGKYFG